jgi:glutathione peroxidase
MGAKDETMRQFFRSLAVALMALPGCARFFEERVAEDEKVKSQTIHPIEFETLDGKRATFADYDGKVLLVVNVASECGYTPQYAGLEALHRELAPRGLAVIGFPSNEFGGQEPGDAAAIQSFCSVNFGVTFPLAAKIETKEGANQSPVYRFLGAATGKLPGWNFCKYLIGRDGRVIGFYASNVKPESQELRSAIDAALDAS